MPGGLTAPSAANANGLVVGRAQAYRGADRPVVWEPSDRIVDLTAKLPTFGGRFARARPAT